MGKAKFIHKIQDLLGLKTDEDSSKKKAIKSLLEKLEDREKEIKKKLKNIKDKDEINELKDDLLILQKQIKKGKKLI